MRRWTVMGIVSFFLLFSYFPLGAREKRKLSLRVGLLFLLLPQKTRSKSDFFPGHQSLLLIFTPEEWSQKRKREWTVLMKYLFLPEGRISFNFKR